MPSSFDHTTSLVPKAWIECGLPSENSATVPMQCQPRAYRSRASPVSISRTAPVDVPDAVMIFLLRGRSNENRL